MFNAYHTSAQSKRLPRSNRERSRSFPFSSALRPCRRRKMGAVPIIPLLFSYYSSCPCWPQKWALSLFLTGCIERSAPCHYIGACLAACMAVSVLAVRVLDRHAHRCQTAVRVPATQRQPDVAPRCSYYPYLSLAQGCPSPSQYGTESDRVPPLFDRLTPPSDRLTPPSDRLNRECQGVSL